VLLTGTPYVGSVYAAVTHVLTRRQPRIGRHAKPYDRRPGGGNRTWDAQRLHALFIDNVS